MNDELFISLVSKFSGRFVSIEEIAHVYFRACMKVERIIKREGNLDGFRSSNIYLAMVTAELIRDEYATKYFLERMNDDERRINGFNEHRCYTAEA